MRRATKVLFAALLVLACAVNLAISAVFAEEEKLSGDPGNYTAVNYTPDIPYRMELGGGGVYVETQGTSNFFLHSGEHRVNPQSLAMQICFSSLENDGVCVVLAKTVEAIANYPLIADSNTGLSLRFTYWGGSFKVYVDTLGKDGGAGATPTVLAESYQLGDILDVVFTAGKVTVAGSEIPLPEDIYTYIGSETQAIYGMRFRPGASSALGKCYFGSSLTIVPEQGGDEEFGADSLSPDLADYSAPSATLASRYGGIEVVMHSNELPISYMASEYRVDPQNLTFEAVVNDVGSQWSAFVFSNEKVAGSDYLATSGDNGGFGIRFSRFSETGKLRFHFDKLPGGADTAVVDIDADYGELFTVELSEGRITIDGKETVLPADFYSVLKNSRSAYFGIRTEYGASPDSPDAGVIFAEELTPGLSAADATVEIAEDRKTIYLTEALTVAELLEKLQGDYFEPITISVKCDGEPLAESAEVTQNCTVEIVSENSRSAVYDVRISETSELNYEVNGQYTVTGGELTQAFNGIQLKGFSTSEQSDPTAYAAFSSKYKVNPLNLNFRVYLGEESARGTQWFAFTIGTQTTPFSYDSMPAEQDSGFGVRFFVDSAQGHLVAYLDKVQDGKFINGTLSYSTNMPQDRVIDIRYENGRILFADKIITVPADYYATLEDETSAYFGLKMYGLSKYSSLVIADQFEQDVTSIDPSVSVNNDGEVVLSKKYTVSQLKEILKAVDVSGANADYDVLDKEAVVSGDAVVKSGMQIRIQGTEKVYTVRIVTKITIDSDDDIIMDDVEIYSYRELTAGGLAGMIHSSYEDFTVTIRKENGEVLTGDAKLSTGDVLEITGEAGTFEKISYNIVLDPSLEEEKPPQTDGCSSCNQGSAAAIGALLLFAAAGVLAKRR